MTSKEVLEKIEDRYIEEVIDNYYHSNLTKQGRDERCKELDDEFEIIKQDLDRLEKLEEFASIVKEFITIEKLDGYEEDFITQNYSSSRRISKEKADLVKEVLDNVKG